MKKVKSFSSFFLSFFLMLKVSSWLCYCGCYVALLSSTKAPLTLQPTLSTWSRIRLNEGLRYISSCVFSFATPVISFDDSGTVKTSELDHKIWPTGQQTRAVRWSDRLFRFKITLHGGLRSTSLLSCWSDSTNNTRLVLEHCLKWKVAWVLQHFTRNSYQGC